MEYKKASRNFTEQIQLYTTQHVYLSASLIC
jgi:hypothetical protein